MSKQEVKSIIIVCDACGKHFVNGNDICCYTDDPDGSLIENEARSSEWTKFTDKDGITRHYCPDCYSLDGNDIYNTNDGKAYDAESEEEIVTLFPPANEG